MKALILAAGLGTRLKPWTLHHPKALVEVGGTPMLERVIIALKSQGFDKIVVNIHHFGEQIIDFLASKQFGIDISISDERQFLLDTGGGILNACDFLASDNEPFVVHNVDILSNANLKALIDNHLQNDVEASLLVNNRNSSRKLLIDNNNMLVGWHNLSTEEYRPDNIDSTNLIEVAFSGIYTLSTDVFQNMISENFCGKFPIMDYFLNCPKKHKFHCCIDDNLKLVDIGKPETLRQASNLFNF